MPVLSPSSCLHNSLTRFVTDPGPGRLGSNHEEIVFAQDNLKQQRCCAACGVSTCRSYFRRARFGSPAASACGRRITTAASECRRKGRRWSSAKGGDSSRQGERRLVLSATYGDDCRQGPAARRRGSTFILHETSATAVEQAERGWHASEVRTPTWCAPARVVTQASAVPTQARDGQAMARCTRGMGYMYRGSRRGDAAGEQSVEIGGRNRVWRKSDSTRSKRIRRGRTATTDQPRGPREPRFLRRPRACRCSGRSSPKIAENG